MRLALLPKKTRGATVHAALNLHYGDADSASNRNRAGTFTTQMLMRGTSKHTRQQLQEELDRLKARIMPIGNATSTRFSIEATRDNLPAVMRLLAEVLREPSFPENEFEQLKQSSLARAEQMRSDPMPLAQLTVRSHLSQYPAGDVRHVSLARRRNRGDEGDKPR